MEGTCCRLRELRNAYNILVGKLKGIDHFGDLGVGGRLFGLDLSDSG
jgi:hypothetical protein